MEMIQITVFEPDGRITIETSVASHSSTSGNSIGHQPKHDLKLLEDLWYKRNPCHDNNADTGEDMFWGTVACVIDDYLAARKSYNK